MVNLVSSSKEFPAPMPSLPKMVQDLWWWSLTPWLASMILIPRKKSDPLKSPVLLRRPCHRVGHTSRPFKNQQHHRKRTSFYGEQTLVMLYIIYSKRTWPKPHGITIDKLSHNISTFEELMTCCHTHQLHLLQLSFTKSCLLGLAFQFLPWSKCCEDWILKSVTYSNVKKFRITALFRNIYILKCLLKLLISAFFRPSIRFSGDEAVACRLATNEIQFFDSSDFSKGIVYRLRIAGIAALELSKAPGSHVAAFVPESKVCCFMLFPRNSLPFFIKKRLT